MIHERNSSRNNVRNCKGKQLTCILFASYSSTFLSFGASAQEYNHLQLDIEIINYKNTTKEIHQKKNPIICKYLFPDTFVCTKVTKDKSTKGLRNNKIFYKISQSIFLCEFRNDIFWDGTIFETLLWTSLLTVIQPRGKTQGKCLLQ